MLCFEQHFINVQMCVCVTIMSLLSCDLIYPPSFVLFVFLARFFFSCHHCQLAGSRVGCEQAR